MTIRSPDDWKDWLESHYRDELDAIFSGRNEDRRLRVDWWDIQAADERLADAVFDGGHDEIVRDIADAILTVDFAEFTAVVAGDRLDITVEIVNIPEDRTFDIGDFKPEYVDQHIAIVGQVSVMDDVSLAVEQAAFACPKCVTDGEISNPVSELMFIDQPDGDELKAPIDHVCGHRGPFDLMMEYSDAISRQIALLTPPPETKTDSMSADIEIQLLGELVGDIRGGERVKVFGELKTRPTSRGSRIFDYFMEVQSVEVIDGSTTAVDVDDWMDEITDIAESDDPVEVLKDSFAPEIFRHGKIDDVIEAVLLQMVGSTSTTHYRSDIHVMVLGDPGTGKSRILKAAESIHPRAKYKNGESVTAAGLTAAATKDDFGSTPWTLKPGLMVLSNGGLAILDEIDKAPDTAISSLHSVLESQTAAVSKAGIDAELPAATSLLSAGNPEGSTFNNVDPLFEQVGFPASILSRFDLIFLIKDTAGLEDGDGNSIDRSIAQQVTSSYIDDVGRTADRDVGDVHDPDFPREALTAYIAHARDTVSPVVEDRDVVAPIEDLFTDERLGLDPHSPIPMTARFVDSMMRLSHASARLRLSDVVEKEDVNRAIRLTMASMNDTMRDPTTGQLDPNMYVHGQTKSQADRRKSIEQLLDDLDDGSGVDIDEFWDVVESGEWDRNIVEGDIEQLKQRKAIMEINGKFKKT
jgi:replicative DNA helicase Mcm